MRTQFLVTITGLNQPQLIKKLADRTQQNEGLWLNSKIIHLGGGIAALIHVDVPETSAEKLKGELQSIEGIKLEFSQFTASSEQMQSLEMKFETDDRPGIVKDITNLLSADGVIIEHMALHRFNVPTLGKMVFCGEFALRVPPELDKESLVEELEALYDHHARVSID